MLTISVSEGKEFLRHVDIRMRQPVMLWGQPGVGKSEMIGQLSEEENALLLDIRLSQYDSVDLRGIPDLTALEDPNAIRMTKWCQPATMPFRGNPNFPTDRIIILFLDEMNSASIATLAVAYQLVNDRRVGEHELMDNVVVIAAGNREGDRGVTNKMPLPLANRFTHAEIGVSADDWCYWMMDAGYPAEGAAFIQFRKPLLSNFDQMKDKPVKTIATPRTWVKALTYYADQVMPDSVKHVAMAGAVGEGPSNEFWGFVKIWQQVRGMMSKVVSDPRNAPLPDEASMKYAVAVSISGSMDLKTIAAYDTYLTRMEPEFRILAWQMGVRRDKTIMQAPQFIDLAKQQKVVFQG